MSSPWAPPPPTSAKAQSTTSSGGSENAPTTGTPQNVDVSGLHLEEGDTTTTVAIGQDTYTIVTSRKPSKGRNMVANNAGEEKIETNANGDTIRIFRRSRSGRPMSATSQAQEDEGSEDSKMIRTEDLPTPDSSAGAREANLKLKQLIGRLREDATAVDPDMLISNLEYVAEVVSIMASRTEETKDDETVKIVPDRDETIGDDLSELQSEAVPEEVRKWLASTFAKQETGPRRSKEERPSFRSVANAIRTGIFIEKIYRRMSSSQLMVFPPEVQHVLKGVDNWNFDTFGLNRASKGTPLRYVGYELLTRHGCLHKYKVPPSMLETMLGHVEAGYTHSGNPYHNNMHACDVLQTTHYFISQTGLANWMSDLEIFTSLMAAIIHDYDHTGTTNNFHINSGSGLAYLYNDRAVLENHHVSAFFRLLNEHDCNIFANMQKTDFREFRNLIIEMVLHTDMSQHFSQLKAIKTMVQQNSNESSLDKTKVLCLMLHSCDVSHPSKRWSLHHRWTARCMEEFFVQGDREKELGLEYSPLCDRHNTMVPQSQIGFIDYIVLPTMNVLGDALDLVLSSIDPTLLRSMYTKIQEDDHSSGSRNKVLLHRPWTDILMENREKWQKKHDAGEKGIKFDEQDRPTSAFFGSGSRPSTAILKSEFNKQNKDGKENENENDPLKPPKTPYHFKGSEAPATDTKLEDVVDELPDHVISRSGTPNQWAFDDKEPSLKTAPPRPTSATCCTPPVPRKVPISVDHHLRK